MLRFSTTKILTIVAIILYGCLLAAPNLLSLGERDSLRASIPGWVPSWVVPTQAVTLGLDLQGGSHVLLEVDQADLLRSMTVKLRDDVRRVFRETRVPLQGGIQPLPRGVQFRVAEVTERERILPKLRELSQPISNPV